MITREQVADLQPGDVVELTRSDWPGVTTRGPITKTKGGDLLLADLVILWADGSVPKWAGDIGTLTVISRAPRPLYINHPRTEPVAGDVARDADSGIPATWHYDADGDWLNNASVARRRRELPARLRLLVDGTTGQVVP